MWRAQTAAEYVTLMALIFVLVASLMLISFRQQEVTLAIASSRLGCIEFNSLYSNYTCKEIRYFYSGQQNVTIVPVSTASSAADKNLLSSLIIKSIGRTFKPDVPTAGSCFAAAYYTYCVNPA